MARPSIEIDISPVVRAKAAASPSGASWIRDLPHVIADLEQAWSITLTGAVPGGTASVVARAVTQDGRAVVLKVAVPGSGSAAQAWTLRSADGDGYVRLLGYDAQYEAILKEALSGSLRDSGLIPTEQLAIMGRLLQRAWRPSHSAIHAEPQNKAVALAESVARLWLDLGRPCPADVVECALRCAARRAAAFDPAACVVLHGDAATANAARVVDSRPGTECGFVLLDPEGFVGDPVYDLGVAVRDWSAELLAAERPAALLRSWCAVLAREASVDEAAIQDWGYLERDSTGLYALSLGDVDHGTGHLRTAKALLAES